MELTEMISPIAKELRTQLFDMFTDIVNNELDKMEEFTVIEKTEYQRLVDFERQHRSNVEKRKEYHRRYYLNHQEQLKEINLRRYHERKQSRL